MSNTRLTISGVTGLLTLALFGSLVLAASDTRDPTSAASTTWTNPTNIYSDDAAYASYDTTDSGNTLKAITYGFAVPAGTVDGIEVLVDCYGTAGAANNRRLRPCMTKDNSSCTAYAALQSCAKDVSAVLTFGSPTDLWGTTWSVSEVNAANFGAWLQTGGAAGFNIFADNMKIRVYYTVSGGARPDNERVIEISSNSRGAQSMASDKLSLVRL